MDGVFNIYKEKGFTSHDVVAIVRKTINQKKVGHTGTLDPEAEGVLPICVGKATKLADYIMADNKTYKATVKLGIITDTLDIWGEVLEERNVSSTKEEITDAVKSFIGKIEQIPPMYSAIKINGQKLYQLARKGIEVERKSRSVEIFDITVDEFISENEFSITVYCSKGTYIRSLCADIGEKLGCGATMTSLVRLKTGAFDGSNAITLDALKALAEKGEAENALLGVTDVLRDYKKVKTVKKADKLMKNGAKIYSYFWDKSSDKVEVGETVLGLNYLDEPVGLYKIYKEEDKVFIKSVTMLL